jgi:hypothetical protein
MERVFREAASNSLSKIAQAEFMFTLGGSHHCLFWLLAPSLRLSIRFGLI